MRLALLSLVASLALVLPAAGHEFWIDPLSYSVAPGEPIVADLRVGQGYKGNAQSYSTTTFRRFEIAQGEALTPVTGILGDRPALYQAAPGEGLAVVLHVTKNLRLTYSDPQKFRDFVTHKGAAWALDRHKARGLPEDGFSEAYSRHAKALVAVGDGAGADREYGLLTEITALANPYSDDLPDGLPVRVTYEGAPRAGAQVEVFEKAEGGGVEVFTVTADEDGRAVIPVRPGCRYMLDSVVLREPSEALAEKTGVVWESLWANLTFEVPAR